MGCKTPPKIFVFALVLISLGVSLFFLPIYAFNPNIVIVPELDISRFAPYKIHITDIVNQENASSVTLTLKGINSNTVPTDCWNYFVDGTCDSETLHYNLNHNEIENRWETGNVFPDDIYPEIFFAPSEITWHYNPLEKNIRRESYEIFYLKNPFDMVGNMSFWIEINAIPNASNTSDLQVYLANKNTNLINFNSDWRNEAFVELVGTLSRTASFHHTHTSNSSHHLVSLQTNIDGTVGGNNLDISEDFWIILYSQSPNIARGWNLRYHPSEICDQTNNWYSGNQFGWTTTPERGCPDVHIHIARRSEPGDGVNTLATVTYTDESVQTKEQNFFFGELPNLPPNPTSFITPQAGTYSGIISIAWEPATDPNNDNLIYTVNLLNLNETLNTNIITNTAGTSTTFDSTAVNDGEYLLKGEICDNGLPIECTEFMLDTSFTIDNIGTITALENINISSSNATSTYAKEGDQITLTFTSLDTLNTPSVNFYSAGYDLNGTVNIEEFSTNTWQASIIIQQNDKDGFVSFDILSNNLDKSYYETTDESFVLIEKTIPEAPLPSHQSTVYNEPFYLALESEGETITRYTNDGTEPTCTLGQIYSEPILINKTQTIKAVSCTQAGNQSEVLSLLYTFEITNETELIEEEEIIVEEKEEETNIINDKLAKTGTSILKTIVLSIIVLSTYTLKRKKN